MKKAIFAIGLLVISLGSVGAIAVAAFQNRGDVKGSTFTVGNADMKLLDNLSGSVENENLLDEKQGPVFTNIYPDWAEDYALKLYNNGSLNMDVFSSSSYATADDPDNLREYIFVEIFDWNDVNINGTAEPDEVSPSSYGKKTILKWKTEGIPLGLMNAGGVKGLVLRFSSESLSDTKQGKVGKYDFVFDGTTDGVSQITN